MILVFIIFALSIFLIATADLKLKIEKVIISNNQYTRIIDNKSNNKKINFKIIFFIQLYILKKIRIINIKITEKQIKKIGFNKNIMLKNIKNNSSIKKENLKTIQKAKFNLEELNLKVELGVENVIATSGVVALISSLIALYLSIKIDKYKKEKYSFSVIPKYINKNVFYIDLNGIISIKIVHIIYVIKTLLKLRSENKNESTSNRKSYDYSYE